MSSLPPIMIVLIVILARISRKKFPLVGETSPIKAQMSCNNFASWGIIEPNDRLCQGLAVAGIGICDDECILILH